jgi:hypothetical protein
MTSLLKFLTGIFLLQGGTLLLGAAALKTDHLEVRLLLGALALILGLITALWFVSIAGAARTASLAKAQQAFSREREALRVKAEQAKARVVAQAHRRVDRARTRLQGKAGLRAGAALAAVAGLGMVMVLTQFVTLGLLTLTAGGSAVAGYLMRQRREARRQGAPSQPLPRRPDRPAIEAEVVDRATLPRP